MKYLLLLVFFFGLMVLAIFGFGYLYTDSFNGRIEFDVESPLASVYDFVSSVEDYPKNHSTISGVDIQRLEKGQPKLWKEQYNNGSASIVALVEKIPNNTWTVQVLSNSDRLTGTWSYYFSGNERYCHIVLIENSSMTDPFQKAYFYIRGRDYFLKQKKHEIQEYFASGGE